MHLMGLLLGLIALEWGFGLGGELGYSLDYPTLIVVVGSALGFTYFGHRGHLLKAIGLGLSDKPADAATKAYCAHVLQTLRTALMGSGIATGLIGGINMSRGLENMADFGPAFAVLLLGPLYGVVFGELIVAPAMRRLQTGALD